MAYKVTLSIPDMLYKKMEHWRESFNLSKMFQEALSEAIQKKEEFKKRFSEEFDMPEIIKRLQQEKSLWEKKYYKKGKLQGLKWAKSASYEDLLYVLTLTDAYQLVQNERSDGRLTDYFEKIYESSGLCDYTNLGNLDHEQVFLEGWLSGVQEFWDLIKEKL